MNWIGVLAFCLCVGVGRCSKCPDPCRCFDNFDEARTITVDCRGQELFEIPYPIPPETSYLDVSNNLIQFVREVDISGPPMSGDLVNLKFLLLQNNELMDIEPGALAKVPNLEVLRLTNNRVKRLRNGTFNGLSNLRTLEAYNLGLASFEAGLFDPLTNIVMLDLSYNNLETIPSDTFSGHQRLQRLLLSSNFLTTIEENAISDLPSLTTVNLSFNQLRALATDSLSNVGSIRSLSLQGNPLECGCCAVWLYNFLQANNLNGPLCEQPEQFRELPLLDLMEDQLCELPTARISGPSSVVLAAGNSLQLDCVTTGSPPPEVVWSRNGSTFDPEDSRIRISGMTLMIVDLNESDSGMYNCIATSSAGQVSVAVPVYVVNVTSDFNVVEAVRGDIVLLDCVDMRELDAPLTWTFNFTELELSDKYTVIDNGSLLIRDVGLTDMGDYTCAVGDIELLHKLQVSAAPTFTMFPEGSCENPSLLMIDSDQNVDFVCAAFGIPPPTVLWVHEMDVLNITEPPAQLVGGTTVVSFNLFRPGTEESGDYVCRAFNELDSVQRTVTVDVRLVLQPGTNPTLDAVHFVGDTAVLECDTGGRIAPGSTVTWGTRSGLPLPFERVRFTCDNATLVITNLTLPNDRDGYECIVQMPDGLRSRVTYDLILNEPPVIDKDCAVPVVTALVGRNVTLPCMTQGTPDPMYLWTVNGSALVVSTIANRSTVEVIGQELNRNFGVRLNISSVRESDTGLYNCTAFSTIAGEDFMDSYVVQLQVQRLPYFTYQPENTAVVAGSTATLLCGGRGNPTPSVTWFFQQGNSTTIVVPDLRHVITADALLIQQVQPGEEGGYFCEISSPLQTRTSSQAYLRVYIPPMFGPLVFGVTVPTGSQNVTLDCFGSGDPVPDVGWLLGDVILPVPGEHVVLANGSLVLLSVGPSDRGQYMCRLANVAGMIYHNITLNVQTLPDTMVQPSIVTANVGCQVTLRCSDGGRPPVDLNEIDWRYEGEVLMAEDGRVDILSTGELVLSGLEVGDSGNYTCTLWSALGSVEQSSLVIVEDPIFASGAPVSPPNIATSTPRTQTLPLLTTVQFVCFVEGFPPPTIVWLRDGEPQPRFSRVTILDGGLTISQLRITDNATYTCVASNPLGEASIDFQLIISAAPAFNIRPLTQSVLFGGTLSFSCSASGIPPPSIMWLHNGSMVVSEDDPPRRVFIDPLTNSLSVVQVTRDDGGTYSCVARNIAGTAEFTVPVFVQDIMIPPNITTPPESVTTEAGLSVVLDCIVFGIPTPSLTWLKDDFPLDVCTPDLLASGLVCVTSDSVFIQSADEEDTGRYTCITENSAGTAVYEAFVTVETATSIPVFDVLPTPTWLEVGSRLQLDCHAIGSPTPNITWLLNFKPINATSANCSSTVTLDVVICFNGSLIIEGVNLNHTGLYTCVADNGGGVNQVSVFVDVRDQAIVTGPLSRPVLTATPTVQVQLLQGVNLTLNCSAEGNPPPVISWFRGGTRINFTNQTDLQQLPNGSLVLTSVTDADGGEYTCLAENSLGTAEVTFVLDFDDLRRLASGNDGKPIIVVAPGNSEVMVGSKVIVDCVAKGRPNPAILWEHDHKLIHETNFMHIDRNGSLMITSAQANHSGNYTCMASNEKGSTHTEMKLNVKPTAPPFFKQRPGDIDVLVGGYAVLECRGLSVGRETLSLHWYRGDTAVSDLPDHKVFCDGTSLLVSGISKPGAMEYSCVASSVYGNSTAFATVRITSAPIDRHIYSELRSFVHVVCDGGVWQRRGKPFVSTYVGKSVLLILQSSLADEGEYTCIAGTSSLNYYLHITDAPEVADSSPLVQAHPGETAFLKCSTTGRPRPLVTWYKELVPLVSNNKHVVLTNGTLLLYDVTVEDEGVYTCKAESTAGEAKATTVFSLL